MVPFDLIWSLWYYLYFLEDLEVDRNFSSSIWAKVSLSYWMPFMRIESLGFIGTKQFGSFLNLFKYYTNFMNAGLMFLLFWFSSWSGAFNRASSWKSVSKFYFILSKIFSYVSLQPIGLSNFILSSSFSPCWKYRSWTLSKNEVKFDFSKRLRRSSFFCFS